MMVILFAQRVILGRSNFKAKAGTPEYIPETLQAKVAQEVLDAGLPELVPIKYGGTMS